MPDQPAVRAPRRDTTAADAGTLERLGRLEPQPIPAPPVPLLPEPGLPPTQDGEA